MKTVFAILFSPFSESVKVQSGKHQISYFKKNQLSCYKPWIKEISKKKKKINILYFMDLGKERGKPETGYH